MSSQELQELNLPPGTVQYKVETRTITLEPSIPTAQDLDLRLRKIELQVENLAKDVVTRNRVAAMILSGLAGVLFGGLSVFASMTGNDNLSVALLTPAFIGSVSSITLAFLVSRD